MSPPSAMKPSPGYRKRLDEISFTRNLRYAIADSEERALIWGYVVASGLGLLWLLLVFFLPAPAPSITLRPPDEAPVAGTFEEAPAPTAAPAAAPAAPAPAPKPAGGDAGQNAKTI